MPTAHTHSATSSRKTSSSSSHAAKVSATAAKDSATRARKTGRKTAHGQAWTDRHSDNPSSTGHGKAKKEPAKQTSRCWPGYEPVPGTTRGEKGSCRPKAHQTPAEKKSDAMAAAASKLRRAKGSKSVANHAR